MFSFRANETQQQWTIEQKFNSDKNPFNWTLLLHLDGKKSSIMNHKDLRWYNHGEKNIFMAGYLIM